MITIVLLSVVMLFLHHYFNRNYRYKIQVGEHMTYYTNGYRVFHDCIRFRASSDRDTTMVCGRFTILSNSYEKTSVHPSL